MMSGEGKARRDRGVDLDPNCHQGRNGTLRCDVALPNSRDSALAEFADCITIAR